jgi:hypothetical protein
MVKIPRRSKTLAITFAVLSACLTAVATVIVIGQSGYGSATPLYTASVYIAFWPSFLLQMDRSHLFVELVPFVVNCIGWAFIGFLLGFLFRKSSQDATPTI